ncbi:MAG: CsbD family protein [Planctomycetota bacterium]|jgi:uncharacterized protein YjbJ (UPF0337 family)
MNWINVKTDWAKVQKQVHTKWNKLTDDDLKKIGGEKNELVARLRERYEFDQKKAETEADKFVDSLS